MKKTNKSKTVTKKKPSASVTKKKSRKRKIMTPAQVYLSLSRKHRSIINFDQFEVWLIYGHNL